MGSREWWCCLQVLHLAAAGEAHSEHPLGRAILAFAREQLCIEAPPSPSPGEGGPLSSGVRRFLSHPFGAPSSPSIALPVGVP